MENTIEVIGVDVGNGYTKTVHTEFVSAKRDWGETKPALKERLVEYKGKFYTVGGDRTKTKTDRKEDETCLILALAGIAEELRARGKNESKILLSEGLPLERCTEFNRVEDEDYYLKGQTIEFKYEDEPYKVEIVDVLVNPQCVAGAIDMLANGEIPDDCLLIDIGSWTSDIVPIEDGKPQGAKSQSLNNGVIECMLRCNESIRRRFGKEIPEKMIQQVMRGNEDAVPPKYSAICVNEIKAYAKDMADTLEENKYNIDVLPCVFFGGGASVIKKYGKDKFPLAMFVPNIRANAIGYEKLGKNYLRKKGLL